jgi:P-type Ca2+ transporter type 2C
MADTAKSQTKWFTLSPEEVGKQLQVDRTKGLSAAEAQQRLQKYGPNQLAEKKKESGWQAFLRQYQDLMQIVLLVAALINQIFTGEWGTTIVLVVLTIFNAVLGMRGEAKAAASLAALAGTMKNVTTVRRDGTGQQIDVANVVPGDVVLMEAGDRVPADGRLVLAATLEIEEAALTGESVASPKDVGTIANADAALGDRHDMAFMNTNVTRGRGELIVTTTGMGTEMGHIADLLNKTESDKTPLQKQLDRLTMIIASLAGVAFILMVIMGKNNGQPLDAIFIAGVALAVAAIPTGLPAVVTTMYSMGTRSLAAQGAIVKRLPSVETLGSVSAICSDKTGTLTMNQMTVREITTVAHHYTVTGEGYSFEGQVQRTEGDAEPNIDYVMFPCALCNDSDIQDGTVVGDPTEGALYVLAQKGGINVKAFRESHPRIAELPFDSDYKFMATFHKMKSDDGKSIVRGYVKGAPDVILDRSSSARMAVGKSQALNDEMRQKVMAENNRIAGQGLRVLAFAQLECDEATFNPGGNMMDLIHDLELTGLVAEVDPPRAEAKAAIAKCHSAGIQVRMITGDHAVTAAAIGHELGIEGQALTGAQFAAIPDEQLKAQLDKIGVVARVSPEDKIRLVTLLQQKDNIVAMTGDGVNDAPALKKADIGVAMGITGTEVSKGAAVMILTDDNFATIVKAVEYGRHIYHNLFNFVRFQMEQLVAFILCYLLAAFLFVLGGTPFSAFVVLFLNFLITVPVAMALGFDKPAGDLMSHTPRPLKQPILSRSQWMRIIFLGILTAIATIYLEGTYEATGAATAATMGFVTFALLSVAMGLSARSETASALNRDVLQDRNQLMLYGVALLMTILACELSFMQRLLGLTSLSGNQWLICIVAAIALLLVDEVVKIFMRRNQKQGQQTVKVSQPAPAALPGD